ncbi:major facilitator superfamily domain-containing protein [Dipodascopsis uninucleata]
MSETKELPIPPPDTSLRAWLTVVGAFTGVFASFGYVNVIGLFQQYYAEKQLSSYTESTIAWITSLQIFIMIFSGSFVGRVYDMIGPRLLLLLGSVLLVTGIMTTSVCKEYYQFILAQGICTGIGMALMFNPCMSAVAGWFIKNRALSVGVAASGSSFGGVILPIVFYNIERRSSFGWAVRAIGFIMALMCIVSVTTVSSRIPQKGFKRIILSEIFIDPFRDKAFSVFVSGMFLVYLGVLTPLAFIPSQALSHGFSDRMSLYLISITSAASSVGRVLGGFLADRLGKVVVFCFFCALSGIFTIALWIPATGHVPIILYALCYGFTSGTAVSLWAGLVPEFCEIPQIGTYLGATCGVISFAALTSTPIAGAMVKQQHGSYWSTALFAGLTMLTGSGIIFIDYLRKELSKLPLRESTSRIELAELE